MKILQLLGDTFNNNLFLRIKTSIDIKPVKIKGDNMIINANTVSIANKNQFTARIISLSAIF